MNLPMLLQTNRINARVVRTRDTPLMTRYEVATNNPREIFNCKDMLHMYYGDTNISYGNGVINIDIPRKDRQSIPIRPVLEECEEYEYPIGVTEMGDCLIDSLNDARHVLVVGQTGSGKSICLKSIAAGLATINHPDSLQLVLMDFKLVDLTLFDGLPHLMYPVVTDYYNAISVLNRLIAEMNHRYQLFRKCGCRTIEQYNTLGYDLPMIVVIIDELADLMLRDKSEAENLLQVLTQKSGSCGMHLILSTQSPRSDVLPGIIKCNLPTTIAFKTRSKIDSRVSMDINGCEELIGNGDGYYFSARGERIHFQGCYVSDEEINNLVKSMKSDSIPCFYDDDKELFEPELLDPEEYYPTIYQKQYSYEEKKIMEEIVNESLSIREIRRRYRIGQAKAIEYQRMAKQIYR